MKLLVLIALAVLIACPVVMPDQVGVCFLSNNVPTWVPECGPCNYNGETLDRDCVAACAEGWREEAYIACKLYRGKLMLNEQAYQAAVDRAREGFLECIQTAWTETALMACMDIENTAIDQAQANKDAADAVALTGYASAIAIADANYLMCASGCCGPCNK